MNTKLIPFGVSIELTARCNVNCIHCYQVMSRDRELNTAEVKKLLDDLSALGAIELTFTGGEPLMRSDFSFILKYAVEEKGFSVKIFSNLTLLDESSANLFASLPINVVETSVLGPDSETHDSITQVNGSFDSLIRGIKMLTERNVRVLGKTVVMKNNFARFADIISLFNNLGISFKYDDGLFVKSDGFRKPLSFSISERDSRSLKKVSRKIKPNKHHSCNAAKSVMSISPDGNVFPCGPFTEPAGNIRDMSLRDIWYDSPLMKMVRSMNNSDYSACVGCFYIDKCNGCVAMGMGLSQGRIHPCFLARKKLKRIISPK